MQAERCMRCARDAPGLPQPLVLNDPSPRLQPCNAQGPRPCGLSVAEVLCCWFVHILVHPAIRRPPRSGHPPGVRDQSGTPSAITAESSPRWPGIRNMPSARFLHGALPRHGHSTRRFVRWGGPPGFTKPTCIDNTQPPCPPPFHPRSKVAVTAKRSGIE
jgi:hypothetical protein